MPETRAGTGWIALAVGTVAGLAVAAAPAAIPGRVAGASPDPKVDWLAAALVAIAALAPAATAAFALVRGRLHLAAGVLGGAGAVAIGMVVLDIALLRAPINANRFELVVPSSAATLDPGPGVYLVLAGHVLFVLAGVLALTAPAADESESTPLRTWWPVLAALAIAAGVALYLEPWSGRIPPFVVLSGGEGATLTVVGTIVVGVALLVVVAVAVTSGVTDAAVGGVLGAVFGVAGLAAAHVVGGYEFDGMHPTGAAWIALLALGALGLFAAAAPPLARRVDRLPRPSRTVDLSGLRWHVVAGCAVALAAVLLVVGGMLPVLAVPHDVADPEIKAVRVAILAGIVLLAAGLWLFFSEFAATVRPAVGVLLGTAAMAATGVLAAAAEGLRAPGVNAGAGTIVTGVGLAAIAAAAVLVWLAGAAEREEFDRSDVPVADRAIAAAGGVAAALAVPALTTPLFDGAASAALPWGLDSWGQALFAAVVVGVGVVGAYARPARAAAGFAGAAVGLAVYLAGGQLSAPAGAGIGVGTPIAVAAIVALAVASGVAVTRQNALLTSRK